MIPADRPPRRVYLLLHEARPLREQAERELLALALPDVGLPAFNHGTYRAAESGVDALNTARTLPMMAARRLVVLRDMEEGSEAFYAALSEYLAKPSDSTVLALVGSGFPKVEKGGRRWSATVPKAVAELGGWELDRKIEVDPVRFAGEQAMARGKRLDPRTARQLVELVGPRLGALEQEIEKLSLYAGDEPEITSTHVDAVCAMVAEAEIWDLTTALASRDRPATLAALRRLEGDGLDPRYLLNMITWKLRSFVMAAEALREGANDGTIAKVSGLRHDDVRRVKQAVASGLGGAHEVLGRLARANFDMNGHRAGDRRILERLVIDWLA